MKIMYEWRSVVSGGDVPQKKSAFTLHTLFDHSGYLSTFVVLTDGHTHDINVMKDSSYGVPALSPDSILLVDRAYIGYNWLHSLTKSRLYFVTRMKKNMKYTVLGQQKLPEKTALSPTAGCALPTTIRAGITRSPFVLWPLSIPRPGSLSPIWPITSCSILPS